VHFTREPIVESVITPREGCKLVVRNSKGIGQEEHFVDAVEVVNFGPSCFYRSLERPKPFLVPCSDYEVLEVRETRVVLRHVAAAEKGTRASKEKASDEAPPKKSSTRKESAIRKTEAAPEPKKERRKRRRKTADETPKEGVSAAESSAPAAESGDEETPKVSRVIPPPQKLISESIGRYKEMLVSEAKEEQPPAEAPTSTEDTPDLEEPKTRGFAPGHLLRRFRAAQEETAETPPAGEESE
jgi:hypothetical protein